MSTAVRIWEDNFKILMKIRSKSERNALLFALVSYGFYGEIPQDLKLNENNLLLFEVLKNNFIAKNQGGAPIGNFNRCSTVEKKSINKIQPLSENIKHKTEIKEKDTLKGIEKEKTEVFSPHKKLVPLDWLPKEATIAKLNEKGFDADKVVEKFINSCHAKNLKYIDFDRAVLAWDWSRDSSVKAEEECWL